MSEISDAIQNKCLAFGDRIIKLNDYLLKEAANKKPAYKIVKGKRVYEKSIPVYLQSVSALCNQLLRSGTSIGANNAEAIAKFRQMLTDMDIQNPVSDNRTSDIETLSKSVNPIRLKNNPVELDDPTIYSLYERIIK